MDKLLITGYTSKIVKNLLLLIEQKDTNISIIKCGRDNNADIIVDFSCLDQTRDFIDKVHNIAPKYIFLNHGLLPGKQLFDTPEETINESIQVNLVSVTMIIEALATHENLRTVVMSSISGKAGSYDTLYAACKAGVDVVLKKCATTMHKSSRLNAVSPGIIADAKMTTVRKDNDVLLKKKRLTPTQNFTTAREVAHLVYYLLFNCGNIHGENINVNGGIFIR